MRRENYTVTVYERYLRVCHLPVTCFASQLAHRFNHVENPSSRARMAM